MNLLEFIQFWGVAVTDSPVQTSNNTYRKSQVWKCLCRLVLALLIFESVHKSACITGREIGQPFVY